MSINTAVEGNVAAQPGNVLAAGYSFLLSDQDPATTVTVNNASFRIDVTCPDGSTMPVLLPLPSQKYDVPARNLDWVPSSDPADARVWQAQVTVPDDLCGGQPGVGSLVHFAADFVSTTTNDPVQVRIHYGVLPGSPDGGSSSSRDGGSWMAPDGGSWMAPDGGSWMAPDGGSWMTPDGGPGSSPDAGSSMAPDAGSSSSPDAGPGMAPDAGPGMATDAGSSPPPTCTLPGGPCSGTGQDSCCNGLTCQSGTCQSDSTCSMSGECCTTSADCCSGLSCEAGVCQATSCSLDGACCTTSSDCCSGLSCAAGVCQPPPACSMSGDSCSSSSDCCSGLTCQSGTCQSVPTCLMSGGNCTSSSDCCSGLTCQSGTCQASSCTGSTQISNAGAMEGNLQVLPNDVLEGGYDLNIPVNNQATTVSVTNVTVTVLVTCANQVTTPLAIHLPDATFTMPAGNTTWFPSDNQQSSLVWQGDLAAPPSLCNGQGGYAPQGAQFSGQLTSNNGQPINVRFHYASWTRKSSGSWSSSQSYKVQCP